MNLIREECEKALKTLQEKYIGFDVVDELICFKNLIEECFDNPPLTFEELKEDKWVWDKKYNQWIQIDETWSSYKKFINVWIVGSDLLQTIEYEPDRFYRKEVRNETNERRIQRITTLDES